MNAENIDSRTPLNNANDIGQFIDTNSFTSSTISTSQPSIPTSRRSRRKGDLTKMWFAILLCVCTIILLGIVYHQRNIITKYRTMYGSLGFYSPSLNESLLPDHAERPSIPDGVITHDRNNNHSINFAIKVIPVYPNITHWIK